MLSANLASKLPVPLMVLQPFFSHIVNYVVKARPELFARLGKHNKSIYVINPLNLPFNLKLIPDPENPSLTLHHKNEELSYNARISGTFFNLLKMIDGGLDGDALFFTRDLKIEGDTEAIVCLRNAMDDLEGSIVNDITGAFGPFKKPLSILVNIVRRSK